MNPQGTCYLCGKLAQFTHASGKDAIFIECETCGHYGFASPDLFKRDYTSLSTEKKAMLSAYTRNLHWHGERPPELGDLDMLMDIIDSFENKSMDEQKENLIMYLKMNSREFGIFVNWAPDKDYPITYSFSSEGSAKIVEAAVQDGLVEIQPDSQALRLTEKGWRRARSVSAE